MEPLKIKILLLEDEVDDAELIEDTLAQGRVDASITHVRSEPTYREALEKGSFDVILADYALPRFDGIAAIEMAQRLRPAVPVVIISGAIGEELAVEMLRIGASDYILKSRPDRLIPVILRCLRESRHTARLSAVVRDCIGELRTIASDLRSGASVDSNALAGQIDQVAEKIGRETTTHSGHDSKIIGAKR
jgi:DNA-binding NtrC family response regulator